MASETAWDGLRGRLRGELHRGQTMRRLYATDASEYEELPAAVAFPATEDDVRELLAFARAHRVGLIPRTAGTSLAGQVVGAGLVVDLGRHLHRVLAVDPATRRARVQPGVVRNELNALLRQHGLFFGPETSTANRAMIGGMVGNNSCGANSLVYGSTREHLVSARGLLADGTEVTFGPLTPAEFAAKAALPGAEGRLYREVGELLRDPARRALIRERFPRPSIPRRNTGYALDLLMDAAALDPASERPFNFCRLLAGAEGTLFLGLEFELDLSPLPPPHAALLCAHFATVDAALRAVAPALGHAPHAVELIDRHVLEATKRNLAQARNRFFVEGDPGAILAVEIRRDDPAAPAAEAAALVAELRAAGLGHAFPVLTSPEEQARVWDLRRAGQGLVSNVPGDAKPREVVEDTAVDVRDLPAYIAEFDALLRDKYGLECVFYAHAGAGELHARPLFNLKTEEGRRTFRAVAEDIAALVAKYRGSLSGEHGDGRLRGEFIPRMVGPEVFALMRRVKELFDPDGLLNPGKIIDPPPMDRHLRHDPARPHFDLPTVFDFSSTQGILRAIENCNGSGDCRKGPAAGGTMCPSYMATRREEDTTRARANALRHLLNEGPKAARRHVFDDDGAKAVLDLCLSCKGCKSECPSNVDLAKLKAEFLQHYQDARGVTLRTRLIASFPTVQRLARLAPWAWNTLFGTPWLRRPLNRLAGFHPDRTIPPAPPQTFRAWFADRAPAPGAGRRGRVWLLADEFTHYSDPHVGRAAVELLEGLGYAVDLAPVRETARARLSKGLLREARKVLAEGVAALAPVVTAERPLVGLEPSALLTFRDEAIDLATAESRPAARALARHCLLLEEFLAREAGAGRIGPADFTAEARTVYLHGHCFQKALAGTATARAALALPANFTVREIPSGCCGMAGSFGYEAEHYAVSQQIGELVLFPAVRAAPAGDLLCAPGTSCRHQIHDGTGRRALHPAEILRDALRR